MSMNLESVTLASVSWALDVAALRQQVMARNIAHANVEGYVRQQVDFDTHVQGVRQQLHEHGRLDGAALASMLPSAIPVQAALGADGAPMRVQLDTEMADMAGNALHYQTLVKGLTRHLSILALAASDGKR